MPNAIRLGWRKEAVGLKSVIDRRVRAYLIVDKIRLAENVRNDLARYFVAPRKMTRVILRSMTWLGRIGWVVSLADSLPDPFAGLREPYHHDVFRYREHASRVKCVAVFNSCLSAEKSRTCPSAESHSHLEFKRVHHVAVFLAISNPILQAYTLPDRLKHKDIDWLVHGAETRVYVPPTRQAMESGLGTL